MSYVVLARKYRPQTFAELTGQEHVSRTLQNAIDTGRVAHAFLFTGARGVGKTSSARILAKVLNCEQGMTTEPCNTCPVCKEITDGISTDVAEIDGASNARVEEIRDILETARYLPSHSRYKIFIIDEVHMLSISAFNALLKTLEEPPEHVKFIFATTEPHKVPVTILSRCQRFDFKRISLAKLTERLRFIAGQEGITVSDTALAMIARKGDGSMRDSLSLFDQVLAFCGNTINDEDLVFMIGEVDRRLLAALSAALFSGDAQGVLAGIKAVDSSGYNMRRFCQELIDHFRNILVIRSVPRPEDILDLAAAELDELRSQSEHITPIDVQRRLTLLLKAETEMAVSSFPRLVLEIALLKGALLTPIIPVSEVLEKIRLLETGAVHTPPLPWNTERSATPAQPSPVVAPQVEAHRSLKTVISTEEKRAGGQPEWERFVAFALDRKASVGSILEYGSAIIMTETALEIGFPAASYYYTAAQDKDFIADVQQLSLEMTGRELTVKVVSIEPATAEVPRSIIEKKKLDAEQKLSDIKRKVAESPVINEALRLFGASITEITD